MKSAAIGVLAFIAVGLLMIAAAIVTTCGLNAVC